jgi:hypothetical protein
MRTNHIIISELLKSKNIQVDLIPENDDEKRMLDHPTDDEKAKLGDHIVFYLLDGFPSFAVTKFINDEAFPLRTLVEIVSTKGI